MIDRYTRLRLRRAVRHQQKKVQKVGSAANQQLARHVISRWRRFANVRRYVIGWLVLVVLLITGVFLQNRQLEAFYTVEIPVSGGTYREGVVGKITNMNPIFSTSSADRTASKLMFNSLLKYNEKNNLVGSLAEGWSINQDRTVYTVRLRRNVVWHDGEPFTAKDVLFTYRMIKHPDTSSYLNASWQDIKVAAKDDYTVEFTLPNPFTPFLYSLAQGGIIPEHVLGDVPPSQLRSHPFNTSRPVGTGPFAFDELVTLDETKSLLRMKRNSDYFFNAPQLDNFVVETFDDRQNMIDSFIGGELAAIGGLRTVDRQTLANREDTNFFDLPLNNAVFLFFKMSNPILSDVNVRKALTVATDQNKILNSLDSRFIAAKGPLLKGQIGYNDSLTQLPTNLEQAAQLLDEAGWQREGDGIRSKDGKLLELQLVAQNSDDYAEVAGWLKEQYARVGVKVDVLVVNEDTIQQNHIVPHNYQLLLAGITIGKDPDVYAYWHSSQGGVGGFNLSEFKNSVADDALEAGRTRAENELRQAKYETFVREWINAAPAVALYQPAYGYAQRNNIENFDTFLINSPDDRFASVHTWRINTKTDTTQ